MVDKTFTIVGVSTQGKITKFRVANGDIAARLKVLERNGHTDINLAELPVALTKAEAIAAFKSEHPEVAEVRMPNEKTDVGGDPKIKTVTIKGPGNRSVVDAATSLLNSVDAVNADVEPVAVDAPIETTELDVEKELEFVETVSV